MKPAILLIIPNLGRGGAQQVFREQLLLYARDFQVTGCVFNWEGAFAEDRALPVESLHVPAGGNVFAKAYYFLIRIKRLRKLKTKLGVDVAISHLEGADYVNVMSRGRERVVTWVHGTKQFDAGISGWLGVLRKQWLIPWVYQRSDQVVAVSQGIREELTTHFGILRKSISVVINGVDLEFISRQAARLPNPEYLRLAVQHKILITHCRLARQKNLMAMLEIFTAVSARIRMKLVILGDGELRRQLLEKCADLNLSVYSVWGNEAWTDSAVVYFLGHQQNPYSYLKHATAFFLTSLWEGFPLSLIEALACGLPVLAADCPTGPAEILAPGRALASRTMEAITTEFGILLPVPTTPGEEKVWEGTLIALLSNELLQHKLSASASRRAHDFDKRTAETAWTKLITG